MHLMLVSTGMREPEEEKAKPEKGWNKSNNEEREKKATAWKAITVAITGAEWVAQCSGQANSSLASSRSRDIAAPPSQPVLLRLQELPRFCVSRSVLRRHVPLPAGHGRPPEALRRHWPPLKIFPVEIHGDAASFEECLGQFTAKEWFHGENMYKCDGYGRAKIMSKAWKRHCQTSSKYSYNCLRRFQVTQVELAEVLSQDTAALEQCRAYKIEFRLAHMMARVDKPCAMLSLSSYEVLHDEKTLVGSLFGGLN
ncbi:hypothetical protein PIB30_081808 [Stylosanthes scabra]|uniref:Uncharacterized protein n=1 Tax=Stylosanthes scabra TaxID=79078 RepID=A0ABU6ZQH8_9FABA|nr:hypothetical protein [Stylosanthes scabra]